MLLVLLSMALVGFVLVVVHVVRASRAQLDAEIPGLAAWRAVRRDLSPREVVAVVVAQAIGRPVTDPRLVAAAQVRGACARGWFRPSTSCVGIIVALQLPRAHDRAADGDVTAQVLLVALYACSALGILTPWLVTGRRRLLERSLAGTPMRVPGADARAKARAVTDMPADGFAAYERAHQQRVSILVGPLFAALVLSSSALVLSPPAGAPWWLVLGAPGTTGLLLLLTGFGAVPQHRRLTQSFDPRAHRRLLRVDTARVATAAGGAAAGALLLMTRGPMA